MFDGIEFTREPAGLYDPLRYMIAIGGKRIRPRLCLTTYSFFSDTFDEGILSPATALEVFHSFTLMHDDIMDRSPLRRGMPTVWTKWNEDTAILSGDVMLIDAYRRIAKAPAGVAFFFIFNHTTFFIFIILIIYIILNHFIFFTIFIFIFNHATFFTFFFIFNHSIFFTLITFIILFIHFCIYFIFFVFFFLTIF